MEAKEDPVSTACEESRFPVLCLRRSKSLTICTSVSARGSERGPRCPLLSPFEAAKVAGKAPTFLAEKGSPMAGPASRALLRKALKIKRRTSLPCSGPGGAESIPPPEPQEDILPKTVDGAIADVGFCRLVYKKARSLRTERATPYKSLKEMFLDIRHAVRVCKHVKRFVEDARIGVAQHKLMQKLVEEVGLKPKLSLQTDAAMFRQVTSESQKDESINQNWLALLGDLSPTSPAKTSWMLIHGNGQIPTPQQSSVTGFRRKMVRQCSDENTDNSNIRLDRLDIM